jgi:hypothetical protein
MELLCGSLKDLGCCFENVGAEESYSAANNTAFRWPKGEQ